GSGIERRACGRGGYGIEGRACGRAGGVLVVPYRTCVGCRRRATRTELVRIVCAPDGTVEWDRTGGRPGRGAYVCSTMDCVRRAVTAGRLSRALRNEVDDRSARGLMEE